MLEFELLKQLNGIEHGVTQIGDEVPEGIVMGEQVHQDRAEWIDVAKEDFVRGADALMTRKDSITLGVRCADCVPILFAEEKRGVVGVIHAGWRGTALEITRKTIESLGFSPHTVKVGIGPAIGPESFEVGEEVAKQFPRETVRESEEQPGVFYVDLWQANVMQLLEVGVPQRNIEVMQRDTFTDETLYSFRGGDREQRNISWIRTTR